MTRFIYPVNCMDVVNLARSIILASHHDCGATRYRFLQNVLTYVVAALRDNPDRYLLLDKMQLTSFANNTIINYSSFLESRRPSRPEGDEQFVRERVLEMAERTFENLQTKESLSNYCDVKWKRQSYGASNSRIR